MIVRNNMNKPTRRSSKLTPILQSEMIELIKAGNYVEVACDMVGLYNSTYNEWMRKAESSTRANKYTHFSDTLKKAQAFSEARDVALIARAGEKHWRAAAWRLERRYPERWGRQKLGVKHSGNVDGTVSHIDEIDRRAIKEALNIVAMSAKPESMYD